MVKFEGQLSDECVLYRTKFSDRVVIIGMSVCLLVGLLIVLLVYFFGYNGEEMKETLLWLGMLAVILLISVIGFFRRKKPRVNVDIELLVDSEFIEYTVIPFKTERIPVSRVKKVVKIGQRYYIIRRLGDVSTSLMAEESLLKEGTIEEFEALFGDKLVVKTK